MSKPVDLDRDHTLRDTVGRGTLERFNKGEPTVTEVIAALSTYWQQNPSLRLGQILGNAVGELVPQAGGDPYYVPDLKVMRWLNERTT